MMDVKANGVSNQISEIIAALEACVGALLLSEFAERRCVGNQEINL